MRVKILRDASQDLIDGYHFYERQSEGVGRYFLSSLIADIESLVLNARIYRIIFDDYHCLVSKRFPFAVYYKIEEDIVVVHAVLDSRRDPESIRRRLK